MGTKKIVTKKENGKILIFPFNLISEEASEMSEFHLKRKRAYINIVDQIVETINDILKMDSKEDTFLFNYCQLTYQIIMKEDYSEDEFIKDLYDYIIDEDFINLVEKYVEKNYISHLKERTGKNESLQFVDEHCKILLKISMSQKLIIPIILEYSYRHNVNNIDEFLECCFELLIDKYEGNVKIVNKLYQTVNSKIAVTQYSDQVFWNLVEKYGEDISTFISTILSKMLIEIIPKYNFSKNLVSLNHVSINNYRDQFFRLNFKVKFNEINNVDEDLGQFDKMEILNSKIDEGRNYFNDIILEELLSNLKYKFKLEKYRNIQNNKIQRIILFLFYGRQLGRCEILFNSNYEQYLTLLLNMVKELKDSNFKIIPKLLLSNVSEHNERRILNKKQILKIVESENLNEVLENYKVDREKQLSLILSIISMLSNSIFVDRKTGDEINYNKDVLSDEVIRFIRKILK